LIATGCDTIATVASSLNVRLVMPSMFGRDSGAKMGATLPPKKHADSLQNHAIPELHFLVMNGFM